MNSKEAEIIVKLFEKKYSKDIFDLACYASFPVVVTPEFINLLNINFFEKIEKNISYAEELELILSSIFRHLTNNLYEIPNEIRKILLKNLNEKFHKDIKKLALLLWQYTEKYKPWTTEKLNKAQNLTALNFLEPNKTKIWLEKEEKNFNKEDLEEEWFIAIKSEFEQQNEVLEQSKKDYEKKEYIKQNEDLVNIPEEVFNIVNLERLDLSKNKIAKLPSSISKLKNLKSINLSENELVDLPNELTELVNLEEIYLNKNRVYQLPNGMNKLKNLKKIFLFNNYLNEIPNEILKIENLEILYLNLNNLSNIPNEIINLKNLKEINLSSNKFKEFPQNILNLKDLKVLNLSNNEIIEIPEQIVELKELEKLGVSGNKLKEFSKKITKLKNLISIDFSYNNITEITEEIGEMINLEEVILSGNKIAMLPKSFSKLLKLKGFHFSNNTLTDFPEQIFNFKNILSLDLSDSLFNKIPTEIGKLEKIEALYLSNNNLTDLPDEIRYLKNLRSLSLTKNKFAYFPMCLLELENLKTLFLYENNIVDIPKEIKNLISLEELYLSKNNIFKVPREIFEIKKLKYLNLNDNKIIDVPNNILNTNDPYKIKDYILGSTNTYFNLINNEFKNKFSINLEIDDDIKFQILKKLALTLFLENKTSINFYSFFQNLKQDYNFKDIAESDVIKVFNLSFIQIFSEETFEFTDKSLIDYIVSLVFIENINNNDDSNIGLERFNENIIKFIAEKKPNIINLLNIVKKKYDSKKESFIRGGNALSILTKINNKYLNNLDLSNLTLICANLDNSKLDSTNFSNSDLRDTFFKNTQINKVEFTSSTLSDSNFSNSICIDSNFSSVFATNIDFKEAHIVNNKFTRINAENSNFSGSIIEEYTSFTDAILVNSRFKGAKIKNSFFINAKIFKADFSDCIFDNVAFDSATYDIETIFPKDFDPKEYNMILLEKSILLDGTEYWESNSKIKLLKHLLLNEFIKEIQNINSIETINIIFNNLYRRNSLFKSSNDIIKIISEHLLINNEEYLLNMANNIVNLFNKKDKQKELLKLIRAIQKFDKYDPVFTYEDISEIYSDLNNLDRSLEYILEAITFYEESNNYYGEYRLALCYKKSAEIYIKLENFNDGIKNILKAIDIFEKKDRNDLELAKAYNILTSSYKGLNKNKEAYQAILKAIDIFEKKDIDIFEKKDILKAYETATIICINLEMFNYAKNYNNKYIELQEKYFKNNVSLHKAYNTKNLIELKLENHIKPLKEEIESFQSKIVFDLPRNFKKSYESIFNEDDIPFGIFKRKRYSISLPLGLTKNDIENNVKNSINKYLSDKNDICAIMIFVYRESDIEKSVYTVARAVFAPQGDIAKADEFKSYKENKLVIDFRENYFIKETDKRALMNIGDIIVLDKNINLSLNPDNWEDNIVFKTNRILRAKILDKVVYPMGEHDLIRYKVQIKNNIGWVSYFDIYDYEADKKWKEEKNSQNAKEYFIKIEKTKIENRNLFFKIKTNFPDNTNLLISIGRTYYREDLTKAYSAEFISKDFSVKNGEIKVDIKIDDNVWYNELLDKIQRMPSIFSLPKKIEEYVELSILFSPLKEQTKEVLAILGSNGEFIKGKNTRLSYGKTMFEVNKKINIPFKRYSEDDISEDTAIKNYIYDEYGIKDNFKQELVIISDEIYKHFKDRNDLKFEINDFENEIDFDNNLLTVRSSNSNNNFSILFDYELNIEPLSISILNIQSLINNEEKDFQIVKFKNGDAYYDYEGAEDNEGAEKKFLSYNEPEIISDEEELDIFIDKSIKLIEKYFPEKIKSNDLNIANMVFVILKKLEYSIRLDKGENFIAIVFNYKGFMCTYSFDKEKDHISLNVRHTRTNYGDFIELMNNVEYYNEIELSDYIIKDFKKRAGYNMIHSYREFLKKDFTALAVVTDGRNLEINENGVSQTGIWKISEDRVFDKVLVFYRDNNENKIYVGDYSHKEKVEDRYNIFFNNTKFVGFSAVNWTTFCERTGSGFSLCYLSL